VDCKNTLLIMTSNAGSARIQDWVSAGEPWAAVKQRAVDLLRETFRPEFLNRIDEIVVFHPLSREHLTEIVALELAKVQARLADRHIVLDATAEAKAYLGREGYDPAFGARPLRRTVQREIENVLARRLLAGELRDGDTVRVDVGADGLVFERREASTGPEGRARVTEAEGPRQEAERR
jgi:ATP-dependent Clp protease ATP-binding subunit ClpB